MTTEQTIAIILAIVVLAIILLVGCLTDLLRETNVPGKAYSFSRFQLFLWTMTILPIFSLHWGFRYYPGTDKFLIDKTGLILLGCCPGEAQSAPLLATHVHHVLPAPAGPRLIPVPAKLPALGFPDP